MTPRPLPLAIAAMAALLVVKSAGLVVAAQTPAADPAASTPAATAAPLPAALPIAAAPPQAMPVSAAPPPQTLPTEADMQLLQALRRRSAALDQREAALAARENLAAAADKRLQARLDQLSALQDRLQALEAARQQRTEAGWDGLVRIYEAMKPRDAATIFDDLDEGVLLQVVDRMGERKAALVLAAMQPGRARQLTDDLAALRSRANQVPASP